MTQGPDRANPYEHVETADLGSACLDNPKKMDDSSGGPMAPAERGLSKQGCLALVTKGQRLRLEKPKWVPSL